ncbi:MAG: PQQ-dependent sugar dehydrogenase [Micrococcus sp.]|nr:PQQ-dependent sugar dehydrogenase [Micrococcus sp.]
MALTLTACTSADNPRTSPTSETTATARTDDARATEAFTVTEHGTFSSPWSMAFLPGTDELLVAERGGALILHHTDTGARRGVDGVPEVLAAGQGGLHDVVAAPSFADDGALYLTWVRQAADGQGSQGVLGRATLNVEDATLSEPEILWEQSPTDGAGHFSLRVLIQDEHLFLTSGDRQKLTPAQERDTNLGKVLRLTLDGDPAPGNPWADEGSPADQIYTLGHRNPLGIAEDVDGDVWVSEMGPRHGDELNLLQPGANYGWPEASMGNHYDGTAIPDHAPGDGFNAPAAFWDPAISPGSLGIYTGDAFADWTNSALLGGLSGQTLVRVVLEDDAASIADTWDMGERIRAVQQAPDGTVWLLEDGEGAQLLQLRPR